MSLNSILHTASNAVSAYQAAISVTGQNISNAKNEDYSTRSVNFSTTPSVNWGGHRYGTGVQVVSVTNSVNQIIENALTSELSNQAALKEAKIYMTSIENLFSEGSKNSLNTLLDEYWSAWEDLGNKPSGETEQNAVYDAGSALTKRINTIYKTLSDLTRDLNSEISSAVTEVNRISGRIARLNLAIVNAESTGGNANDLKDERNALVDDLGERININTTVKKDGTYLISTHGLPLVEDGISYDLSMKQEHVYWTGKSGNTYDITDEISGGAIAGWLEVRDVVISETRSEFNELAKNLIWTLNYQHSQGAGQSYFSGRLAGTYKAGGSGTFASLFHGNKIDYTKDFSMMIRDLSNSKPGFQDVTVDMAISTSRFSNISGAGEDNSTYAFTVIDKGTLGERIVTQSSGALLGGMSFSSTGILDAVDAALAKQTLTITNSSGTQTLNISDNGSGAARSAADIARKLSRIDGIDAYASKTSAHFDLSGIASANNGDVVEFTVSVDGVEKKVSFTVDSSKGALEKQFKDALKTAAKSINEFNKNTDLAVNGTSIESAAGASIGIFDFNVVDNAGITLSNFQNFNTDDSVSFTLSTSGATSQSINISVDLKDVNTADSSKVAQAFYKAVSQTLKDNDTLTAALDESTGELTIMTTDGSSVSLSNGSGDTGNNAGIDVAVVGTSSATPAATTDGKFDFNGSDQEGAQPTVSNADLLNITMDSSGSGPRSLRETGSGVKDAVAITGAVTIIMDPGMKIHSDEISSAGLFGTSGKTGSGSSVITLGGEGEYQGFDNGENITFEVDGQSISYVVAAPPGTTDAEQAQQLYNALSSALPPESYEVVKNGASVSIVKIDKNDKDAIKISKFSDNGDDDAVLGVSTGNGAGSKSPANDALVSGSNTKNSTTAVTFGDPATVHWEIFDSEGNATGKSGYVEVDEAGKVEIVEDGKKTLRFDISEGSLVAGNTLRINTDGDGRADILDASVTGKAASVDDTYEFTVVSGGTLPDNKDTVVIKWRSENGSGTIELEGNENENAQISVEVDGMTLAFDRGTLVNGDVFYVTTDDNGEAVADADGNTIQTLSDWHWTLNSFADEFNRRAGGVTASVTENNTIVFDTNDDYCAIENVSCSKSNNINKENFQITVLNHSALEIEAKGLEFVRKSGIWRIANDPTGSTFSIIPEGGDDDGFQIDMDGDGIGDIDINFKQPVSGDGYIRMDLEAKDADNLSYAFAGEKDKDSGLAAALGVNTFFTGTNALNIGVNDVVSDGDLLASGIIDRKTGVISSGNNTNADAMADTRYDSLDVKKYTYTRGKGVTVTVTSTTLDDYQASLVSSTGSTAAGIDSALNSSKTLVYQLTAQRDSISAVSLDEEMINLTGHQQAYLAAAQLLTTAQKMFDALLATR